MTNADYLRKAARAMEDVGSTATWGSPSYRTWKLRCAFSQQRADALRRSKPPISHTILNAVALGIIALFIIIVGWAVVIVVA